MDVVTLKWHPYDADADADANVDIAKSHPYVQPYSTCVKKTPRHYHDVLHFSHFLP